MNKARIVLVIGLVLVSTHQLPAPISEIPESPTPAPTVAPTAKPKPKPSPKSTPRYQASESATKSVRQEPSAKQSRFAGTWTGTMQTFPAGNQTTVLAVDSTETSMTVTWFGQQGTAKTQLKGDTLQATFPPPPFQPEPHTWSLTPQPDGFTARVHFQCFMNDFTATFRRSAAEAPAAKLAK